ncbi:MAG: DUF4251 domain-containing protein [Bacteroidaceae bacterium]|nr:DUF4251 domain-containing protein [Bacteroidaceae bacterium]
MKKFLFILVMLTLCVQNATFAQSKKMTKAEREAAWRADRMKKRAAERAREESEDSLAFVQAIEAIRSGSWALEASNITFRNGVTRFVTESTNYISVNNGQGVVQTAFNNANVYSPNGLGGITLEGTVSGERMSRDKEGNVYYSYTIQGANISAIVYVTIAANSNEASARIDPNFSGNTMTMNGYIYPYSTAGVFQGTTSFY